MAVELGMGEFSGGLAGSWAPRIRLEHLLGDRALAPVQRDVTVPRSLLVLWPPVPPFPVTLGCQHRARPRLSPPNPWAAAPGGSWCRDEALLWLGERRRAATCHPPLAGAFIPGGDGAFWPIRGWKRCRALAFRVSAVANCARGARRRPQPGGVTCLGITKGMGRNGGSWPGTRAELGGELGTPQPGCRPGAGWIWGRTGQEVLVLFGGGVHPGSCAPVGERPENVPIPVGVRSPQKWGPFPSTPSL